LAKKNEYTYIGDDVPQLDPKQHHAFIENYQKGIFHLLVEKNLLTPMQCEQCIEELKRNNSKSVSPVAAKSPENAGAAPPERFLIDFTIEYQRREPLNE
jgi:hypothetical protein